MSTALSVPEVLARLQARVARHREREAFHAQQTVYHQEQRVLHAAELEEASLRLEEFQAAASTASELLARPADRFDPASSRKEDAIKGSPIPSKFVAKVVAKRPGGEPFGATSIAAEVNQRYAEKLRRPVDARLASATLRRLRDAGAIRLVREGKPFHEALYARP